MVRTTVTFSVKCDGPRANVVGLGLDKANVI